ncbi:MAG: hypothetical protein JNK15_12580 [Planctomycetes bacterium]|nr:hypothetical protein [Planctomycetota bacterium]
MTLLRVRSWSWLSLLLWLYLLLNACAGSAAQGASQPGIPGPVRAARVVDERGEPVAGAEVAFLPAIDELDLADVTVDCELLFATAPRARSGADGIVRLPTAAASVAAVARCGDRFGAGLLHFADRTLVRPELVLAPDRRVHVQVRDAAGRPRAFVPVEARCLASQWEQFRSWNVAPIGTTDAAGQLTLWHAQRLCSWDPRQPRFALRAVVVGAEVEFARVDLTEPSTEPVQLVCPPHGWLVVQRWLAPGIADGSEGSLWAWMIQDDYDGARPPQAFGEFLPRSIGTWRSLPVALGQRWRVQWPSVLRDVVGPVQDGDSARLDHVLQASEPNGEQRIGVVVALQRPDGTPCAHAAVELSGVLLAQTSDSERVRADAEGKLRFVTRHGASVEFTVVGENLCAEVALPQHAPDRVVDLGIVRLVPARTLASGRCVDAETGLPIRTELRGDRESWSWRTSSDGTFQLIDDPRSRWASASVVKARVFADRGWQGHCFGYHERRHAILVDRTDNELELPRARLLRSRLRLDAALGGLSIDLRVRLPDGSVAYDGPRHEVAGLRQQAFELPDDLHDPSAARLEVHSSFDEAPLAIVDGHAFRPTPDGFDVELDLRGAIVEYDVFTDGIDDLDEGCWFVRSRGETSWRRLHLFRHVSLVVRRDAEIEAVFAPSFRPWQRRTLMTTYTRWRPEPGSQLELTWNAPDLPGVEVGVLVLLRQLADRELAGVVDPGSHEEDFQHLECEHAWPLGQDALTVLHERHRWGHEVRSAAVQQLRVWQLGQYVVVPYAKSSKGLHWFVEQAVPFELVRAGSKVEVAVRIEAAAMQAALEAK